MTSEGWMLAAGSAWERLWEHPFYQNALWGGLAVALLCSVLSVFVVLKRMSFIGEGVAHAGFGGLGVAMLLGLYLPEFRSTLARDGIIAVFCVGTAAFIGFLSRRGRMAEDVVIGICLVAAMAAGAFLLDLRAKELDRLLEAGQVTRGEVGFRPDVEGILFGNLLLLRPGDVWVMWGLALAVTAAVAAIFKELVFFSFDEETAGAFGVRTAALHYGLLVAIGLAVVAAMRTLGVILGTSLLIIPGASARLWSNRIGVVTVLSAAIGMLGMALGLILTIQTGFASRGSVIVLTMCAIFGLSWGVRAARRRWARSRRPSIGAPGRTG
jgi:ABC-type Mn2+/Zn2+ transport system permease subunit